jgi:L-serine deaminase
MSEGLKLNPTNHHSNLNTHFYAYFESKHYTHFNSKTITNGFFNHYTFTNKYYTRVPVVDFFNAVYEFA